MKRITATCTLAATITLLSIFINPIPSAASEVSVISENDLADDEKQSGLNESDLAFSDGDTVTVTWDANGGQFYDSKSGEFYTTYVESYPIGDEVSFDYMNHENLFREGYAVIGWSDQDGVIYREGEFDNFTPVYEDMVYSAIWKEAVTITFDANGGYFQGDENKSQKQYMLGKDTYLTFAPINYIWADDTKAFSYWALDEAGTEKLEWIVDEEQEACYYNLKSDHDVVVYAIWKDKVTVTWDANGGEFYDPMGEETFPSYTESYVAGYCVSLLPENHEYNLLRDGYVLIGWTDQDGNEYIDGYEAGDFAYVYENMMFSAIWKEAVEITYDANGGSFYGEENNSQMVYEAAKDTYVRYTPSCSWENDSKILSYWALDKEGTQKLEWVTDEEHDISYYNVKAESGMVIYAIWEDAVTVTWDANGGEFYDSEEPSTIYQVKFKAGDSLWIWDGMYACDYLLPRAGYKITGWMDQYGKVYRQTDEDNVVIYEDMVFSAIWEETVKIIYDANGGSFYDEENKRQMIYEAVKDRYVDYTPSCFWENDSKLLSYWALDKEGTRKLEWVTDEEEDISYYNVKAEEGLVIYAIWEDAATITWDANGGQFFDKYNEETSTDYEEIRFLGNEVSLDIETEYFYMLTREGYAFTGWMDQYGTEYKKNDRIVVNEDIVLSAIWKEGVKITIDANGGVFDGDVDNTQMIYYAEKGAYLSEIPYRDCEWIGDSEDNLTTNGWAMDPEGTKKLESVYNEKGEFEYYNLKAEQDITLYVVWTHWYVFSWRANGGSFSKDGSSHDNFWITPFEGAEISLFPRIFNNFLVNDGYVLTGWKDQDGNLYKKDEKVTVKKKMVFYAVWTPAVQITWNGNGEYLNGDGEQEIYTEDVAMGQKLEHAPSFVAAGDHTAFLGWSLDSKGESGYLDIWGEEDPFLPTEDVTLYAIWGPAYRITFDFNGGEVSWNREIDSCEDVFPINTSPFFRWKMIEPEGKTLLGWSKVKNDESALVINEYNYSDEVPYDGTTLYAVWADSCTVKWNGNGGYINYEGTKELVHEEKCALNYELTHSWIFENSDENLTVLGWSTTDQAEDIVLYTQRDKHFLLTGDITLYAIWVPKIRVTLDGNGHLLWKGASKQQCTYDWPSGEPMRELYFDPDTGTEGEEFIGWSTSKDAKDIIQTGENGYKLTEDITLYAIWCTHEDEIRTGAKEPTYSEEGYSGDLCCTLCGKILEKGEKIPALGSLSVLKLPAGLKKIEAEAFRDLNCEAVIIPDGCEEIGEKAFAGCTRLVVCLNHIYT